MAQLHTFTDFDLLSDQTSGLAYGPVEGNETTQYRVTSLFTSTSTEPVNAYAVVKGFVFIQEVDSNRVNLILKPFNQSTINFSPIRFFIYRGLRKSDFLNISDSTRIRANSDASEFITKLYQNFENRIADEETTEDLLSKSIGIDSAQTGSETLEIMFFSQNTDFQFPLVQKGMNLGTFYHNNDSEFGFEIVVEDKNFTPTLNYVRTEKHIVNTTGITDINIEKAKREEILSFIDPAAYYGIHYVNGIEFPGNTVKKELTLYEDLISKFYTKNAVYIDIRNEYGSSYTVHGEYRDSIGNNIRVNLTMQVYETSGWPILILTNNSDTPNNYNTEYINLVIEPTIDPIIYRIFPDKFGVIKRQILNPHELLNSDYHMFWTNTLKFEFPNFYNGTDKENVASYIKIGYYKKTVTGIITSRLSSTELEAFQNAISAIITGGILLPPFNRYFSEIYNALNDSSRTIYIDIGATANGSPGQYQPSSIFSGGIITFKNTGFLNGETVIEELFHAYQGLVLGNTIDPFVDYNVEFEAKILNLVIRLEIEPELNIVLVPGIAGMESFLINEYGDVGAHVYTLADIQSNEFRTAYVANQLLFAEHYETNHPPGEMQSYKTASTNYPLAIEQLLTDI